MYMAKAIAAFVSLVVTSLVSADGIVPVTGTVHEVLAVLAILAGAVTTYAIPNRGTTVASRVIR